MDILEKLGISQAIDLGDIGLDDSSLPDDWEWECEWEEDERNERNNNQGN